MSTRVLATKLYVPLPRPRTVSRPRLLARLNEGLSAGGRLTLISAPAGFGKTTLVSEWTSGCGRPVAWLSLDEGDNDRSSFLRYLIAALQTIAANTGAGVMRTLGDPQLEPPSTESILTTLLNETATIADAFVLVLDDYHVIDSKPVDEAVTFLLAHLPPQMHVVIATREDPHLPLARLRARGQLTELRAADLRFTPWEAAEFLNQRMGLNLSQEDVAALETRTEGWIAGLQLAAISMQGHQDATGFIRSFTGSHRFVLDYLVEEVLQQQSEGIQTFLLRTSILDRMCGALCDAVVLDPSISGQETLEYLERANLFIVPLDNERRWYRYHRLFAELLRQRLQQSTASPAGDEGRGVAGYHIRASAWYEDNGLDVEAFHHATAAHDMERAERLMEGKGMPLHFRGAVAPVLKWLELLPGTALDRRPSLWTAYASVLLVSGRQSAAEQALQSAETAVEGAGPVPGKGEEPGDKTRDTVGRIAAIRATLAVTRHQAEAIIAQSRRALEYLHPDNLAFRTFTIWKLGHAYHLQGNRAAASQAYTEAISVSEASGNTVTTIAAAIGLGLLQESENRLHRAAQTFGRVLQLSGDQPLPVAGLAHLGLARICYEWNDLDAAQRHAQQCAQLARAHENPDTLVLCKALVARLTLARGDVAGAAATLDETVQSQRESDSAHRRPEVAAAQVLVLLRQGDLAAAAELAMTSDLPISQARVHLAQGDPSAALTVLEPWRRQMEVKDWLDERLKVMVIQAVALDAQGSKDQALRLLAEALSLAEPSGFIRTFVDEGPPMARLLSETAAHGLMPDYTGKLLAAFEAAKRTNEDKATLPPVSPAQPLIEPLSPRELEVLRLIAQGLSNREIGERLFLALDTVKGHNRRIYGKLQAQSRTEAIARARELGLL